MIEQEDTLKTFLQKDLLGKRDFILLIIAVATLFLMVFWLSFISSPINFPKGLIYDLSKGKNLSVVANDFKEKKIIKSPFIFKSLVCVFGLGCKVYEGDYVLSKRQNVISLAWRIANNDTELVPVRVTLREGLTSREIGDILSEKLQTFNKKEFLKTVEKSEGYLFPDTYLIIPGTSESEIAKLMMDNFNEKVRTLESKIKTFDKNLSDVIKMASILEGEARTLETRRIVAGILWKRISIGMPLQVDSSFKYINGKTSKTLTTDDLKLDSPYNSYTNKGLPPTPISNPGLMAIEAAVTPIKTAYLYFLTDDEGNMHYAVTHEEHVLNKEKYLK
jgi:UPF0755 protein